MEGAFVTPWGIIPNTTTPEGAEIWGKMMFRGDNTVIAPAGNYWLGLTSLNPANFPTLEDAVLREPTIGVNGYARQAITRDATGWPTIINANGHVLFKSSELTFTASGIGYDKSINRLFLATVETGYAGTLFAISEPLPASVTVTPASPLTVQYQRTLP